MKTIALAITLTITSCAGLVGSISTPWGDIETANGETTITPRAIVVPAK